MLWIARAIAVAAVGLLAAGCGGAHLRSFRVPSSAMEPTIHCAKPGAGCRGTADDHVLVQVGEPVQRGDIIVFQTPPETRVTCGEGGIFLKRLIGLQGETVREDDHGFFSVRGANSTVWKTLDQPYVSARTRRLDSRHFHEQWKVPAGDYFVIGDNLPQSCDSRQWGGLPRSNVIGPVVKIVHG
jgi:signal peptidase I